MQAVILAAGKGKRLQPFTLSHSKAMAPIVGKPISARVLDNLIEVGITDVIFVVAPKDNELIDYFNHNYSNKIDIKFAFQNERLGMGHALNCASDLIVDDFIVSACDSLIPAKNLEQMVALFKSSNVAGVLSLMEIPWETVSKRGVVEFNGDHKIIRIVEKPAIENAPSNIGSLPIYVFRRELIDYLPKINMSERGEYELQDAIQMLIDDYGYLEGVNVDERYDLSNMDDLLNINLQFLKKMKKSVIQSKLPKGTVIRDPVFIGEGVEIGAECVIGPNVFLENGCVVGDGVKMLNVVVVKGGNTEMGCDIEGEVLV